MFVRLSPTRLLASWVVFAAATMLLQSGCQPGGYSGPTGTVSGKATLAGKAVPDGCTVTFIAEAGHVASGKTGAGGAYQLTVAGNPKVPVAKYRATVTSPAQGEMSQADYDKMMSAGGSKESEGKPAQTAIPAAYGTTNTSNLSYDVKEGPNTIDIELK